MDWRPLAACIDEVGLSSAVPTPLQVDGDHLGDVTSVTLRSVPDALTVVG